MSEAQDRPVVQVDIVSDVVCPWCIIGFLQLDRALAQTGVMAQLRWHPFELNPNMPPEGQNLTEHVAEKYGSTPEQSREARDRLQELGKELGFTFAFSEDSKIVNTFQAHQLLDWADDQGRQHPLKLALFGAYFLEGRDVSDAAVLVEVAGKAGLDPEAAAEVLASGRLAETVREKQAFWTARGVRGVPTMIIGRKYLLTGAQDAETYARALNACLEEPAA